MPTQTQLSDHFTLEEMTATAEGERLGLDNTPSDAIVKNLTRLCVDGLEPVRVLLGRQPIFVHSGYRSPVVNALVGGAKDSEHLEGLAGDFTVPGWSNYGAAVKIRDSGIVFDQLILEYGGVHFGLAAEGVTPRQECLTKKSADSPDEPGLQA